MTDVTEDDSPPSEDEMEVSMCAMTGIHSGSTLQLVAFVLGNRLLGLVDSSSTHSFVPTDAARDLGL